ncbi:glycosyltransferase family 4 protein [Desulfovibrio aminophilus]|uniref:glycosyltransferase family 4 protein n=1 Tax=Desulfovibrio aminophilus TaxID=81425 RepID=UPI0004041118|nr:glycosyltransferase family 4 protein [Desulfovibrio aminophilus]
MRTLLFLPPVKRPTGGVAVIRRLAEVLHRSGREAFLVPRDRSGWTPEESEDCAPPLWWEDLRLTPDDLWLVPEGWVNALAPGLEARARCLVYCQNWAYLFSSLPPGTWWPQLPVEFLAVSDPVAWFMETSLGRRPPVLRPGIDLERFRPGDRSGPLTVAFMPRKNRALAQQIRALFETRNGGSRVRWLEIDGLSAQGVAEALGRAHIFLVTGFPEGCPLPPLEALACGCLCVGFSGFGGWDYMRQAQEEPRFHPWWPLREVDWGGNGFWCADGDVLDAALCLEEAVRLLERGDDRLKAILAAGRATADTYGLDSFRRAVLDTWAFLEE